MKKCETCTHQSVCLFKDSYLEYYDKCNLKSEHADKFKVTIDCVHYAMNPYSIQFAAQLSGTGQVNIRKPTNGV